MSTTNPPTIHYIRLHNRRSFETLETVDIDMSTDHSMIEPIDNLNFGNTFQRHNGQNKLQYIHKTLVSSINPYPIKYQ